MKTLFMELKQLALLRRIARALEYANDLRDSGKPAPRKRPTPVKITRKTDAKEDELPEDLGHGIW